MLEADHTITPFRRADEDDLFRAYATVVDDGGAFPRTPPATVEMFRSAWLNSSVTVQVARRNDQFAGAYFLKPNFPDCGSHIANAGYLVAKDLRRQGIGRALVAHSLGEARKHGFDAMMSIGEPYRRRSGREQRRLAATLAGAADPPAASGLAGALSARSRTR